MVSCVKCRGVEWVIQYSCNIYVNSQCVVFRNCLLCKRRALRAHIFPPAPEKSELKSGRDVCDSNHQFVEDVTSMVVGIAKSQYTGYPRIEGATTENTRIEGPANNTCLPRFDYLNFPGKYPPCNPVKKSGPQLKLIFAYF